MWDRLRFHGGNIYEAAADGKRKPEEYIDFSANINPLGIPPGVRRAVEGSLGRLGHYPDPYCSRLVFALGRRYQVPDAWVLCGNGAADLIFRLVYTVKPRHALLVAPTFSEYEEALGQAGCRIRFYETGKDLQVGPDFLDMLTPELDVVFLCNPNNPTGLCMGRGFLHLVLERTEAMGILLVMDECFLDFVEGAGGYTMCPELASHRKLLILKSFTKMFAIPGLRLGFSLCSDSSLIEGMSRSGPFWSVNTVAQAAGLAALEEEGFVMETVDMVAKERGWLSHELEMLGLQVYPGQADYLLFWARGQGGLYEKMLDSGIIIRRCGSYRGLTDEHFRVAVKNREDNRRLIDAMKEVFYGKGDHGPGHNVQFREKLRDRWALPGIPAGRVSDSPL